MKADTFPMVEPSDRCFHEGCDSKGIDLYQFPKIFESLVLH